LLTVTCITAVKCILPLLFESPSYNAPTMLPAGDRQHRGCIIPQAVTHSLVLLKTDEIINHRPKHAELIGIINKPLLLHLASCLYYLHQWCAVKQISNSSVSFHPGQTSLTARIPSVEFILNGACFKFCFFHRWK